jgi:hypothetical protein
MRYQTGLSKKDKFFFLDSPKWEKMPDKGIFLIGKTHKYP